MKLRVEYEVSNGGIAMFRHVDIPMDEEYPYIRTLIVTADVDGQTYDIVRVKFDHSLANQEDLFIRRIESKYDVAAKD